ncbi:acetyl-CoA carboxylase biotin carboxyl carrier protein [Candidatus Margulisiibacteriota bacterium]
MTHKRTLTSEKTAKKLIKLIKNKNIAQISISEGSTHITVKQKTEPAKVIASAPQKADPLPKPELVQEALPKLQASTKQICSENIGTLHLKHKGKTLTKLGQIHAKGEKIAIVTAMKIDNEIKAPYKCKLIKLLSPENSIIEYGSPLFEIEAL